MGAEGRRWSLSILKVLPQASFGETWKTMKIFWSNEPMSGLTMKHTTKLQHPIHYF
jgi:hypothetical protein